MKQRKFETVWIIVLAVVIVIGLAYFDEAANAKKEKEPPLYSVVLYQNTDNEWDTLMDGIEQAKKDYRVKIRYMNLAEDDTAQEQAEAIEREIGDGARGIILAAVDSDALAEELGGKNIQIPMVCVETGYKNSVTISADNYEMGHLLGEKILEDMSGIAGKKLVTVVYEYMQRASMQARYKGLCDALKEAGEEISIQPVKRQKGDFSLNLFVGKSFQTSGDYVAALDKFSTQEAAKAWASNRRNYKKTERKIKIYGIGNTAQTVSDLDNGNLQALVYQNEFNMGYEAVKALVEKEKKGYITDDFDIRSKLVTRETLYDPDNERLLFPNS